MRLIRTDTRKETRVDAWCDICEKIVEAVVEIPTPREVFLCKGCVEKILRTFPKDTVKPPKEKPKKVPPSHPDELLPNNSSPFVEPILPVTTGAHCDAPHGECVNHGACNAADRCVYKDDEEEDPDKGDFFVAAGSEDAE